MEFNRRNIRAIMSIVAFGVVLYAAFLNLELVLNAVRALLGMVSFFTIGLCLAFIMNTPVRLVETRLFPLLDRRLGRRWARLRRVASLLMTVLLIAGIVFLVFFMVIPEIGRTFAAIAEQFPAFMEDFNVWLEGILEGYGRSLDSINMPQIDWVKIGDTLLDLLRSGAGSFFEGTFNAASSVVSGVINFAVGVVVAIYILYQKEKLSSQAKRTLYAYLPEKRVDRLIEIGTTANQIFSNFISGQFLEASILGVLCFIGMSVFRFPFALMVSVLVGVTAFIPIFGALIALVVGAFMILVNQGFTQMFWFCLFFIVLQQIEGNLIYPHVMGKKVMLPGLWVLTAVTLGGHLAGILGMLVSVPLSSLFYTLLREAVNRRNGERQIPDEKFWPKRE